MPLATCDKGCAWELWCASEDEKQRREAGHAQRHHGTAVLPVSEYVEGSWQQSFLDAVRQVPVGTELTTADLHGLVSEPGHVNAWGSATARAKHLGLIREVATQPSELATTKRSLVRRWVRTEVREVSA